MKALLDYSDGIAQLTLDDLWSTLNGANIACSLDKASDDGKEIAKALTHQPHNPKAPHNNF